MIERIPKTFRYRVTQFGLRVALFFTRTYNRLLRPGLAAALPGMPPVLNPHDIYAADSPGNLSPVVKNYPSRIYVPSTEANRLTIIDAHTYKGGSGISLLKDRDNVQFRFEYVI